MFTDEPRFRLRHSGGRIRVQGRTGKRYLEDCVLPKTAYGGDSIMVWAGFSARYRTPLHHVQGNLNSKRYRNQILRPLALPMLRQIGQEAVYQDNNAHLHHALAVDNFLLQSRVVRMDCPVLGFDFYSIKNVWDCKKRQVRDNHSHGLWLPHLLALLQEE